MATVSIDNLSNEIEKELSLYSSEITEGIKGVTKVHAKKLLDKTKKTAPIGKRRSKKFKTSIKCEVQNETANSVSYLWYVGGKNYRLTHLIANGHAKRGGGRTKSNDFLKNAVNEVESEFEKAVEEVIKNG